VGKDSAARVIEQPRRKPGEPRSRRTASGDPAWYKQAIVYELHVRTFHDSDGDGIGDFAGLTAKLDYLQDLGITAIWLLPFYPPRYGTTATTSPTTRMCIPTTERYATSGRSFAKPTGAAYG